MNVVGYDPALSIEGAWRIPGHEVERVDALQPLLQKCDVISLHVPMMEATKHMLNSETLGLLKPNAHILNFSRGGLVDNAALLDLWNVGHTGKYVSDFPAPELLQHEHYIPIPHLGASTEEAEDISAIMAADEIKDFLETGSISNSVNYPPVVLDRVKVGQSRICVCNDNKPRMIEQITSLLSSKDKNVETLQSKSAGEFQYTVIDVTGENLTGLTTVKQLYAIDGVLRVRVLDERGEVWDSGHE
jgi:D-3-phosphoglycerate dehydrogenase